MSLLKQQLNSILFLFGEYIELIKTGEQTLLTGFKNDSFIVSFFTDEKLSF